MKHKAFYRVGVMTTAGVVWVENIEPVSFLPVSQAVVARDFRQIEISTGYHELVSTLLPHYGIEGNFRLTLSSDIETGRSWELPVFLAHLLYHNGQLATAERTENVEQVEQVPQVERIENVEQSDIDTKIVFATGALGADLKILSDDYFIDQKLKMLGQAYLANATILVPNDPSLAQAREATQTIASVDDAWQLFVQSDDRQGYQKRPYPAARPENRWPITQLLWWGLFGAIGVIALVAVGWYWWRAPKAMAFETLNAIAVYADGQEDCFAWLMGSPSDSQRVVALSNLAVNTDGLCGIELAFAKARSSSDGYRVSSDDPDRIYGGFVSAFERGIRLDKRNPIVKLPLRAKALGTDIYVALVRRGSDGLLIEIQDAKGER